MSRSGFQTCFEFTLGQEGQYSDDPNDPGNWTGGKVGSGALVGSIYGISAPTMLGWIGPRNAAIVTADYMKGVSQATAKMIYKIRFWDWLQCDKLPTGVDLVVWDFGVNAGVSESALLLQYAVHVRPDGLIGPMTLAAVGTWVPAVLIRDLVDRHRDFYRGLNNPKYEDGWLARQDRVLAAALKMAGSPNEV